MKYTIEQIKFLMEYRSRGMDDYLDDMYTTEKNEFLHAAKVFTEWLKKMEQQGKIEYILSGM